MSEESRMSIKSLFDEMDHDFDKPAELSEVEKLERQKVSKTTAPPKKIDLALAIAEDCNKNNNLLVVGEALYMYNGRFYSYFSTNVAQRFILQNYRKDVSKERTVTTLKNVVTLIRLDNNKVLEEFPANSNIIVFENGTLEVDTGSFRDNSPDDLANSALGINYDSDQWEMPHTKRFLETIACGDDELYERMLQVIGYILSNDIKAKAFFYLEGVGDTGKSRFCDLIASFFPLHGANKVARIALQDVGGKFALSNLVNTKLNISEDLPASPLSPKTVSRIKMISDANRLEAEAKYVQAFSFRPICKLLFASNYPLRLKEYDEAFVNRVVYVPFINAIPKEKQDKNILDKMQKELSALFNWAFVAYKRLVASGYTWAGSDRFKPGIEIANSGISTDKERILNQFVSACCELAEGAIISTEDLKYAYDNYCQEYNHIPIQGDRFSRELSAVLPDTIMRVKIGNKQRGYKGIRLKNTYKPDSVE